MNNPVDAESESIIEEIRIAFRDVPRGHLSLHQAMIVKYESGKPLEEAARLDNDQHWWEIPDDDLEAAGRAFYGANPLSWRYFMPAFMVWTLRYFRSNDSFVVDQAIYAFDSTPDDPWKQARFATLSPSQCKAACRLTLRWRITATMPMI